MENITDSVSWLKNPPGHATCIRHLLEHNHDPDLSVDYSRYAEAFSSAFFAKHYLKSLLAFHALPDTIKYALSVRPFIDLGSGAGPAAYASLTLPALNQPSISLVDQSAEQLKLARDIFCHATVPTEFFRCHFPHDAVFQNAAICMSYFLCENDYELSHLLNSSKFIDSNVIIVIDHREVLRRVRQHLSQLNASVLLSSETYDLDAPLQSIVGQATITVNALSSIPG